MNYPTKSVITTFTNQIGEREYISDFTDDAKMLTHCAPIFILPNSVPVPNTIHANGTVALIDTGSRRVLVTCEHVWSYFVNFRIEHKEARFAVVFRNGPGLPIHVDDASLIDCDTELDLAVFDAGLFDEAKGFKEFYRIYRFPVVDPKPRQPISFVGFPGEARRGSEVVGHFGYSSFGLTVSDVSSSLIVLANTDPRILRDNHGNQVPPIDIGGMSGAPAYTRTSSGGFNLVGFVRAGNNSNTDIRLSKASFLREDGKLFRPAWHRCPTV
jgi:hypothetical protein